MTAQRREVGQWLAFVAIALLVVAAASMLVAHLAVAASGCACTQAPPPSAVAPTG